MKLKHIGKWEFDCLIRDITSQGEKEVIKDLKQIGFKNWYKNVFLIDEAWLEVRKNYKN